MIEKKSYPGSSVSLRRRVNPVWLFLNDEEPTPPEWFATTHQPLPLIRWYLRNPFQNGFKWGFPFLGVWLGLVIAALAWLVGLSAWLGLLGLLLAGGFKHVPHSAWGQAPLDTTTWWEVQSGRAQWKWSVTLLWFLPMLFLSYESSRVIFYYGHAADGTFGLKVTIK